MKSLFTKESVGHKALLIQHKTIQIIVYSIQHSALQKVGVQ